MLLTLGALITVTASVIFYRVWGPARVHPENHGSMSHQWLVEHRATERL